MPDSLLDPRLWTVEHVGQWLVENGFGDHVHKFSNDHGIDGSCLLLLTEDDLRLPPLQMTRLGDIKKLHSLIVSLRALATAPRRIHAWVEDDDTPICNGTNYRSPNGMPSVATLRFLSERQCCADWWGSDTLYERAPHRRCLYESGDVEPEVGKALLSVLYAAAAFFVTSMVITVVHERVPDQKQYPPLPDIFLDNFPYIPWAFAVSEVIIVLLGIVWGTIVIFHKHRFVVVRRYFSLLGSVFLLRCVTMLITSLSVPGSHSDCTLQQSYSSAWEKLERAFGIWSGMGMQLLGVRTCGDYMFSGHTVVMTMLNMFITEYTPRRWYYLHVVSWIMNLFGLFFILAAHEHYSIDVFVAFYISLRLFQYYHTLADNQPLLMHDRMRTRVWFPLFSFFESKCSRAVPNQFELPRWTLFKRQHRKVKL